MKKIILLFLVIVCTLSVHAQSKITKEKILGKWVISGLEVKGLMYYSVEKDSIALSDSLRTVIKNSGMDPKGLEGIMKQQFANFLAMRFSFSADGTAEYKFGLEAPQKSKYKVDEEKSMIVSTDEGQTESMKAEMVGDKLRLKVPSPEGEVWVLLKKS